MSVRYEDMTEDELDKLSTEEALAYVVWVLNECARKRGATGRWVARTDMGAPHN